MIRQIAEHNAYVQGVAWDPLNEYVATQSSDRSVHIYALKSKDGQFSLSQHNKISRMDLPASRRNHSASPAPPDMTTSAARAHVQDASALLASPIPSAPGTPTSFGLPMNPPTVVAHSRASSFSSSPSLRRSPSPSPALPLPAVKPVDSPKLLSVGVKNHLMYHDDAMTSFFRRLAFTPDGSLLFTPAGQYKIAHATPADGVKTADEIINTVYVYTRAGLNKPPVAHLPGHKKPSVAVSCSPILYTFRKSAAQTKHITVDTSSADDSISLLPPPAINTEMDPPPTTNLHTPPATGAPTNATFALPYRIVYAVATKDSVLIYDTQQQTPLCVVSNLHYAAFTDLTWYVSLSSSKSFIKRPRTNNYLHRSPDGNTLLMTSTDGFCSVVTFLPGELGTIYSAPTSVGGSATSNPMAAAATGVVPSAAAAAGISPPVEPPLKRPPSPFLVSGSSAPRIPINPVRGVNTPTSFPSAASASAGTPESTGELAPIVSTLPGVSSNVSGFSLGAQGPWKTPPATPASTSGVAAPATVSGSGVSSSGGPSPPASGGTVLGKREVEEEKVEVAEGVKEGSEADKGGDKKRRRIVPTLIRGLGEE